VRLGRWMPRSGWVRLTAAAAALTLAACGPGGSVTIAAPPSVVVPTTTTSVVPSSSVSAPVAVCTLLTNAELVSVFPTGAPPSQGNDYGEGFADCLWHDGRAEVLISVMPRSNLQTDYVEQLVVTGEADAPALGSEAVTFPGVVGIGRASSGGGSVGFTKGDRGVIVAVRRSDGDDAVARPQAIMLAIAVAGRV
jgi:hypothetical protein